MTIPMFLEIEYVNMSESSDLKKVFIKHKLPIDPPLIFSDKETGQIYLGKSGQAYSVFDPFTGDPICINPKFDQKFILNIALAPDALVDVAFVSEEGELVDKFSNPLTLLPYDSVPWTQALLEVTFGT